MLLCDPCVSAHPHGPAPPLCRRTEWRARSGGRGAEGAERRVRSGGRGAEGAEGDYPFNRIHHTEPNVKKNVTLPIRAPPSLPLSQQNVPTPLSLDHVVPWPQAPCPFPRAQSSASTASPCESGVGPPLVERARCGRPARCRSHGARARPSHTGTCGCAGP